MADDEILNRTSDIDAFVMEYCDSYVLDGCEDADGREGCYTPTEHETALIHDAINGLVADEDFVTLMGKQYNERQKQRAAEGRCLGCGAPAGVHWGIRPECSGKETRSKPQVGCEGSDGLLRIHDEQKSCDVCADWPRDANGSPVVETRSKCRCGNCQDGPDPDPLF